MPDGHGGMDPRAGEWFDESTYQVGDWSVADLLAIKGERQVSVVIPARNEERTVADVVGQIRQRLMIDVPLVDELVVRRGGLCSTTSSRSMSAVGCSPRATRSGPPASPRSSSSPVSCGATAGTDTWRTRAWASRTPSGEASEP